MIVLYLIAKMTESSNSFFFAKDDQAFVPMCIVHLCIFWYAFSFWLCQPVEPYLLQKLGGDKMTYGYVQTACNICMLIGGPFVGWICDRQGSNMGLICTWIGGALSYFLQAVAWNVPMLLLSKVPYVFLHTMHCSQVCVSHLAQSDRRSEALGRIAMSYGFGQVAGSALGGFLGEQAGYQANSCVSCIVSLANLPLILYFVPTHLVLQENKDSGESKGWLRMPVIFHLLTQPHILSLVVSSGLVAIALSVQRQTLPNVMLHHFHLRAKEQGLILAVGAVVGTISSISLVGPSLKYLGSYRSVVLFMSATLAVCFAGYSFTGPTNLWFFYALTVPPAAASSVLFTIFISLFSYAVPKQQVGTAIAICHGVSTAAGIVMPLAGNYVFVTYGFMVLSLSVAAVLGLAFAHGMVAIGLDPASCKDAESTPLQSSKASTV